MAFEVRPTRDLEEFRRAVGAITSLAWSSGTRRSDARSSGGWRRVA